MKKYIIYTVEYVIIATALLKILGTFSLISTGDGFNQYYLAFVYCGKYFREIIKEIAQGSFSFKQFDFSIGMGEGIIPALNYYGFGDPFLLISTFFPVKYSAYGYTCVYLIKLYISGLAFMLYCLHRKCNEKQIAVAMPCYIASQYILCHALMYPIVFMSLMISVPLMCAGIDMELEINNENQKIKGIHNILCLAVAFQALNGFYTLYMALLFAAVYALICTLYKYKEFKVVIIKILRLFGQVMLGIGIAGIIFIPALIGYFSGARSGEFSFLDLLDMLRPDMGLWNQIISSIIVPSGGLSEIGLMLPFLAVFFIGIAFAQKDNNTDIKIITLFFTLLYLNMKIASWIAGGFTHSIYYARWTFCIIFLLNFMIALGAEQIYTFKIKTFALAGGAILIYLILLMATGNISFELSMIYILFTATASIGIVIAKKAHMMHMPAMITIIIVFACILNIYTLYETNGVKWYLKPYESVRNEILTSDAELYIKESDEFSRMDVQGNIRNEALYIGYNSANEYLSIINNNIVNFYKSYAYVAEMYGSVHHLIGLGARSEAEDMLSVTYYNDARQEEIIENDNYLPLGYTYDSYALEDELGEISAAVKNAMLLDTVVLDEAIPEIQSTEASAFINKALIKKDYEIKYSNVDIKENIMEVTPESQITITFDDEGKGDYYFYTDKFRLADNKANVDVGHVYFNNVYCEFKSKDATYSHGVDETLICLGTLSEENNTITITFGESAAYEISSMEIYRIDSDVTDGLNQKRRETVMENCLIENNKISGEVSCTEGKILFLSIPYGAGWTASIDGKEAKLYKAQYGFMACYVAPGVHQITVQYVTPGIRMGALCSIISVIILIAINIRKRNNRYVS